MPRHVEEAVERWPQVYVARKKGRTAPADLEIVSPGEAGFMEGEGKTYETCLYAPEAALTAERERRERAEARVLEAEDRELAAFRLAEREARRRERAEADLADVRDRLDHESELAERAEEALRTALDDIETEANADYYGGEEELVQHVNAAIEEARAALPQPEGEGCKRCRGRRRVLRKGIDGGDPNVKLNARWDDPAYTEPCPDCQPEGSEDE